MTLEALFARAAQGQAFLLLAGGGVALGALLQLAGALHRVWRMAGLAADVLWVLGAAALVLYTVFQAGTGLRLYALLGLLTGLALYRAGVQPLVSAAARRMQKLFPPRQE